MMCTLIAAGADVNTGNRTTGCTSLGAAAEEGHVEVVRALIFAGADVNRRSGLLTSSTSSVGDVTCWESTLPLGMAQNMKYSEVVSLLVAAGAIRD